jgi:DnaJ family protein C protein 2
VRFARQHVIGAESYSSPTLTFFSFYLDYNEIINLKNAAKYDDCELEERLIIIICYHTFIWQEVLGLSPPQLEQLREKLEPGEIQESRYHFIEIVHIAISLHRTQKGRELSEVHLKAALPAEYAQTEANITTLCSEIRKGADKPCFEDWHWVERQKETAYPLYWYYFCRKAAPRVKQCYQDIGKERTGFNPSDLNDYWKLLALHAYTPESPLCSAGYPLTAAVEATVPEDFKAFVNSKDPSNPKDHDDLFDYWSDPRNSHIGRLYIQKYFPICRRHRRSSSSSISSARTRFLESQPSTSSGSVQRTPDAHIGMATHTLVSIPLPILPEGWSGEKDFKAIASLSAATQRSIEPVGPHFLAHARRARHKRTFSEDDRIQAQENVKRVEDDDSGEISEPEDPMMLSRDAKDWKVYTTQV